MARIEEVEETHVTPGPAKTTKRKETPPVIKYYLAAFNALSALGWSYVLVVTAIHLFQLDSPKHSPLPFLVPLAKSVPFVPRALTKYPNLRDVEAVIPGVLVPVLRRATTTYARVGYQTALVQSLAIMEVVHSLLGFVRSPLFTTATQVWSRYMLVWGVANVFPSSQTSPFYASMVLSWSITEVIRYSHYTLNLLDGESYLLLWLRYTTFYLLYPTGAGSEAFVMLASLPKSYSAYAVYDWARALFFVFWWPGLAFLMLHMQKQRSKALGGGKKRSGVKSKTS
ncbi:hypothetical protein EUX98_g898 [Antrodiella citrinella]|uniref:Very-long-chain (3R)-3-hydroxyacyl-CoA dehydratase n=1 Tax=Antrodiella citrinella TaxID=2447956 RepID=A0A4S4N2R6_9APHY|nr:hypothetical protein EUX98_g898 [Antrodiella citrinella]